MNSVAEVQSPPPTERTVASLGASKAGKGAALEANKAHGVPVCYRTQNITNPYQINIPNH